MRGKLGVSTVTHKMKKPNRVVCDVSGVSIVIKNMVSCTVLTLI